MENCQVQSKMSIATNYIQYPHQIKHSARVDPDEGGAFNIWRHDVEGLRVVLEKLGGWVEHLAK